MMAYDRQFVLSIIHNGSPVREINGKVTLPFNSEYKIRLKNKHTYLRAKARVWVDGRKASNLGDFILNPGEKLDLERFLDESMVSGNRFQFVPLSDSRVNDPSDYENGIIKVEFFREIDKNNTITIDPSIIPTTPIKPGPWDTGSGPYYWNDTNTTTGNWSNRTKVSYTSNPIPTTNVVNTCVSQDGATVEGSHSNQRFVEGSHFQTEISPITLRLKLQGPKTRRRTTNTDSQEPTKARFCSQCGSRRMRGAKFCHRCGHAYRRLKKRY